jgi:hypothetical protein
MKKLFISILLLLPVVCTAAYSQTVSYPGVVSATGAGVYLADASAAVSNSIVCDNTDVADAAKDIAGTGTQHSVLTSAPGFAGGNDYRLTASSPAKNAGNAAYLPAGLTVDLDNVPYDSTLDLGCYQFNGTTSLAAGNRLPAVTGVYPTTVAQGGSMTVILPSADARAAIYSPTGRLMGVVALTGVEGIIPAPFEAGVYFLQIATAAGEVSVTKIIVK